MSTNSQQGDYRDLNAIFMQSVAIMTKT